MERGVGKEDRERENEERGGEKGRGETDEENGRG